MIIIVIVIIIIIIIIIIIMIIIRIIIISVVHVLTCIFTKLKTINIHMHGTFDIKDRMKYC